MIEVLLWIVGCAVAYLAVGMTYAHLQSPTMWQYVLQQQPWGDYRWSDKTRDALLLSLQRLTTFLWPMAMVRDVFHLASHFAFPTAEDLDDQLKEKARLEREALLEKEAFESQTDVE